LKDKMNDRLLTIREVAKILQISERSIYNQVRKGAERPFPIRVRRVGKLIRFAVRDVERYIEKL
jgi:excisionase family DNA binding protein